MLSDNQKNQQSLKHGQEYMSKTFLLIISYSIFGDIQLLMIYIDLMLQMIYMHLMLAQTNLHNIVYNVYIVLKIFMFCRM